MHSERANHVTFLATCVLHHYLSWSSFSDRYEFTNPLPVPPPLGFMKRRLVSIRRRLIPSPQIPKSTDFFQDGYRPRLPADPLLQRARAPFSGLFLPSPQYFDTSIGKVSTSWHGAGRDVWHRRVRAECHGQLVSALPRGGLCVSSLLPPFFRSCFSSFLLSFLLYVVSLPSVYYSFFSFVLLLFLFASLLPFLCSFIYYFLPSFFSSYFLLSLPLSSLSRPRSRPSNVIQCLAVVTLCRSVGMVVLVVLFIYIQVVSLISLFSVSSEGDNDLDYVVMSGFELIRVVVERTTSNIFL